MLRLGVVAACGLAVMVGCEERAATPKAAPAPAPQSGGSPESTTPDAPAAATGVTESTAPAGETGKSAATGTTGAAASTGAAGATGSTEAQPPMRWETDTGLIVEEIRIGTGEEAGKFDHVRVHYVGTLADGREFDNSYTRGQPLVANLGGGVIKGWQEGVPGMKVGGRRRLIVPPELGYGKRGSPPTIPPDAMLIFEVELLEIVR